MKKLYLALLMPYINSPEKLSYCKVEKQCMYKSRNGNICIFARAVRPEFRSLLEEGKGVFGLLKKYGSKILYKKYQSILDENFCTLQNIHDELAEFWECNFNNVNRSLVKLKFNNEEITELIEKFKVNRRELVLKNHVLGLIDFYDYPKVKNNVKNVYKHFYDEYIKPSPHRMAYFKANREHFFGGFIFGLPSYFSPLVCPLKIGSFLIDELQIRRENYPNQSDHEIYKHLIVKKFFELL